jgi:FdhD protein
MFRELDPASRVYKSAHALLSRGPWTTVMRSDTVEIPSPSRTYPCRGRDAAGVTLRSRDLPEETPVALAYGGTTAAVMMATPADLEDFATGFSLTEGLIARAEELADLSVVFTTQGIELRMWLAAPCQAAFARRHRRLAGPTGCGLCGIESLAEASRPVQPVMDDGRFPEAGIAEATVSLAAAQSLNQRTHATHAAGLYRPGHGLVALREDVGRHNALDKLAGALARAGTAGQGGAIVITSRVSVEMVQKAAAIGAPVLIAISAPTALAVRIAEAANITLVALARGASYQVFSHAERIMPNGSYDGCRGQPQSLP